MLFVKECALENAPIPPMFRIDLVDVLQVLNTSHIFRSLEIIDESCMQR